MAHVEAKSSCGLASDTSRRRLNFGTTSSRAAISFHPMRSIIMFAVATMNLRGWIHVKASRRSGLSRLKPGISQPAVSKHLGVLKQAGLVRDRHEGRQTHYCAQLGALAPLIDWTRQMAGFWRSRFDHLENLLKRMDH
jgi:hypothetical protein